MLRIILSLLIGAHGIGHILFLLPLLGIADWGVPSRSWLITGETSARLIGSLFWVVAIIGFSIAVYGLWKQETWWRSATLFAAVISTIGLALFWVTPVSSPLVSALIFNLVAMIALFIVHFPSVEAVGA